MRVLAYLLFMVVGAPLDHKNHNLPLRIQVCLKAGLENCTLFCSFSNKSNMFRDDLSIPDKPDGQKVLQFADQTKHRWLWYKNRCQNKNIKQMPNTFLKMES